MSNDDSYNTARFLKEVPASVILMVDDNATNLEALKAVLGGHGYRLLIAKSGEMALQAAEKNPPAVVLLDINMPQMDGFEVCRRLKGNPVTKDSMVVFLSARGEQEDKVAGLELGAIDYIEKPFNGDELLARVKGHEENYRRQLALRRQNQELKLSAAQSFRRLDPGSVTSIIADGESERVEFKSTLRLNLHAEKNGKEIENASLKTIAAYLNSNGGTLFIGVRDDGSIHGIESDGFSNDDRFLLHLKNLVRDYIGIQFARYIETTLHELEGKKVCVVQCLSSTEPVFFRRDNQEYFYVRVGPSTQALTPSQLMAYITSRKER
jgi:putative two-component system response regulator